jgi:hypothetical protein
MNDACIALFLKNGIDSTRTPVIRACALSILLMTAAIFAQNTPAPAMGPATSPIVNKAPASATFVISAVKDSADSLQRKPAADTSKPTALDTLHRPPGQPAVAVKPAVDTSAKNPADSFDVRNCTIVSAGAGFSLGNNPVFPLWKGSIPGSLSDFGYAPGATVMTADSQKLAFLSRQSPDVYNMVFPITVSYDRLLPNSRYGVSASFSWLSKTAKSSLVLGADALHRHVDITQGLSLYSLSLDFTAGKRIPERYFIVDGVERSDVIVGISLVPLLALNKSATIATSDTNMLLRAATDSAKARISTLSATGIGFGWRIGIVSVHHMSKNGGFEAGLNYYGLWSMRFRKDGGALIEGDLNPRSSSASKAVSYFSGRIEFSAALVRKVR